MCFTQVVAKKQIVGFILPPALFPFHLFCVCVCLRVCVYVCVLACLCACVCQSDVFFTFGAVGLLKYGEVCLRHLLGVNVHVCFVSARMLMVVSLLHNIYV